MNEREQCLEKEVFLNEELRQKLNDNIEEIKAVIILLIINIS